MSNYSSFNKDKKIFDNWRQFLNESIAPGMVMLGEGDPSCPGEEGVCIDPGEDTPAPPQSKSKKPKKVKQPKDDQPSYPDPEGHSHPKPKSNESMQRLAQKGYNKVWQEGLKVVRRRRSNPAEETAKQSLPGENLGSGMGQTQSLATDASAWPPPGYEDEKGVDWPPEKARADKGAPGGWPEAAPTKESLQRLVQEEYENLLDEIELSEQ